MKIVLKICLCFILVVNDCLSNKLLEVRMGRIGEKLVMV